MEFKEQSMGLYVYDAGVDNNKLKHMFPDYSFLSTGNNIESTYSKQEIKRAKEALELYRRLGRSSQNE